MSAAEQVLIEKIKQPPPQRLAEVEDFVDFLRTRETHGVESSTAPFVPWSCVATRIEPVFRCCYNDSNRWMLYIAERHGPSGTETAMIRPHAVM
jgi:hypothetical protein